MATADNSARSLSWSPDVFVVFLNQPSAGYRARPVGPNLGQLTSYLTAVSIAQTGISLTWTRSTRSPSSRMYELVFICVKANL